ncbi:MAG: alpha-amylase family glycosyl hydrolase [Planctomycetota bacterium]
MKTPRYPSLYQINTRVWLTELSRGLGRPATLDDIPDDELDRLAGLGLDWIWFLSVWQTGPGARQVSRNHSEWRREFAETLPDLREEDIGGSGFAITDYTVHQELGGDAALARLRERLCKRGLKLMLDFVPNHMGLGHSWVEDHPDYFIAGTEQELASAPQNFTRVKLQAGDRILAYGRDPYFSGWPDTLQLNYANPELQAAMRAELLRVAGQCDGVRCDMAMLVLPEVFERTWGQRAPLFWPATTESIRQQHPDFVFMAEVYWDLEWTLQQQGFDYTYDKRLYDRLRDGHVEPLRDHFRAGLDYQDKLARFLENHDEPRAAATFGLELHPAAAVITFLSPGLRFFHQGQFDGRRKRISPHLVRGPDEPVDVSLKSFYEKLLAVLRSPVVRDGEWKLLSCTPGWEGNASHDGVLVFAWHGPKSEALVVAVNYTSHASQCHVQLPYPTLAGTKWLLQDQLRHASYAWHGDDLVGKGLFLDMPAWQACVYTLTAHP